MSTYHHGDLPAALLAAAERILEHEGAGGLTLRATARAAGVSHAAPAHHFRDLTGLVSELAAVGFRRFGDRLGAAAVAAGADARARLAAIGAAYVGFARDHPALFLLMFRGERLDRGRESLRAASESAFAVLRGTAGAARPERDGLVAAIASWSLAHGFAMLLIDGLLPRDRPPDELLAAMLARDVVRPTIPES